jgi:hypothetical protein
MTLGKDKIRDEGDDTWVPSVSAWLLGFEGWEIQSRLNHLIQFCSFNFYEGLNLQIQLVKIKWLSELLLDKLLEDIFTKISIFTITKNTESLLEMLLRGKLKVIIYLA